MNETRVFYGSRSGPRVSSSGFPKLAGRVGSDQEVFEVSRVGPDRVGSGGFHVFISHGWGQGDSMYFNLSVFLVDWDR